MPRPPRFRTAAIEALYKELRYASRAARRREMDAAETLVADLDPGRNYPADFILYRVTGYRSDTPSEPELLVGDAVVPDLVTLVQRLSQEAELPEDYRDREALDLDEVRTRLEISPRTMQRYRRQGLVCHYVIGADGTPRLACFADALERFVSGRRSALDRAAAFTRIGDADVERIVDEAATLRVESGVSLNEAARILAERHGRALETMRGILRRHDRAREQPLFVEPGPLSARDLRVLERAWAFGVSLRRLQRRFGKSGPALHHALARRSRQRLTDLALTWIDLPTFALDDAREVILSPPVVSTQLLDPIGADVLALIATAPRAEDDAEEIALIAAYNLLKREAGQAIASLPAVPTVAQLDPIRTDLRWAAMVKRKLVAQAIPAAVGAIEQTLNRRLVEAPADTVSDLFRRSMRIVADEIETLDPGRGHRLARRTAFAIDRALATATAPAAPRAAARHQPGSIVLGARERQLCPWQAWLDPRPDLRPHVGVLRGVTRETVVARYGWDGAPPQTLARLAEVHGSTPAAIARRVRTAERTLREEVRRAEARAASS